MRIAACSCELTLLLLCHLVLGTPALAGSIDVFPVTRGLHSVYEFTEMSHSWSFGLYTTIQDSGTVECIVVDSSQVNDSTISWTIMEKRNLVRWFRRNFPPTDTTYVVADTSVIALDEFTTGNHQLRSSSLTWKFPVTVPGLGTSPVYRLSDSSHVMTSLGFTGCLVFAYSTNYDSVWLSSDSGLYARTSSLCDDHDEWGSAYWRTFRLLSRIVVLVEGLVPTPTRLHVLQNYPNPFNPTTTITYDLPKPSEVVLAVYDLLGRQVAVLVKGVRDAGKHEHLFDGSRLGSGVYFVRLHNLGRVQTSKMILVK